MRIEPSQCCVRQLDGRLATRLGRLASKKPARAFQGLAETPGVEIRTKHKGSGRERLHRFRQKAARATLHTTRPAVPWAKDMPMHIDLHLTMEFWNGLRIVTSILL
jgi:hypothetical protein